MTPRMYSHLNREREREHKFTDFHWASTYRVHRGQFNKVVPLLGNSLLLSDGDTFSEQIHYKQLPHPPLTCVISQCWLTTVATDVDNRCLIAGLNNAGPRVLFKLTNVRKKKTPHGRYCRTCSGANCLKCSQSKCGLRGLFVSHCFNWKGNSTTTHRLPNTTHQLLFLFVFLFTLHNAGISSSTCASCQPHRGSVASRLEP